MSLSSDWPVVMVSSHPYYTMNKSTVNHNKYNLKKLNKIKKYFKSVRVSGSNLSCVLFINLTGIPQKSENTEIRIYTEKSHPCFLPLGVRRGVFLGVISRCTMISSGFPPSSSMAWKRRCDLEYKHKCLLFTASQQSIISLQRQPTLHSLHINLRNHWIKNILQN